MAQQGRELLTLKVVAIALLVVSAGVVLGIAAYSNVFASLTLNPSSSATASTESFNPPANYTLVVSANNCAVNILPSPDDTLHATLNVTSNFFLKASANIAVTSDNSSFEFILETPQFLNQYWGIDAVASVYIPSDIAARSVSASVLNGEVNAEVPNSVNEISLETTNGQISVKGQNLANVLTKNTNGNTFVSVLSFSSVTSSGVNGNIQLMVGNSSSSGSISLSTTNGNVNYLANPASNLSISASTVNGGVTISSLAYEDTVFNSRQFVGTVNGGGTTVVLATVNGNINIGSSLPVLMNARF